MLHPLTVFAGPASRQLGEAVCQRLDLAPGLYDCRRFPDGEAQVELTQSVRGHDVVIVQSTSPPVELHLMELLLLADACRRAGAARTSAVLPYFGYARQERRTGRRSLGARVAAGLLGTAGFARVMLIDAHTPAIEGFFDVPLDHLSAVPLLARSAAAGIAGNAVVVAPDLGAVKLARIYATELRLPMAFIHKTRLNGESVEVQTITGDVRGRTPLIVDDMLSTGGTIEAAADALRRAGAAEPMAVAVTHMLLVGRAREVLDRLPLSRMLASDTVALPPPLPRLTEVTSVAPVVAQAIGRHHGDESLTGTRAPV